MNADPLDQALFNLFLRSGHFLARFETHEMHFTSAHAQRLTGNVHELFHGDVHLAGSQLVWKAPAGFSARCELLLFTHSRTRHVDRYVASANDYNLFADGEAVAEIDVQKKIDAFHDPIQLMTRKIEVAAAVQAK